MIPTDKEKIIPILIKLGFNMFKGDFPYGIYYKCKYKKYYIELSFDELGENAQYLDLFYTIGNKEYICSDDEAVEFLNETFIHELRKIKISKLINNE